MRFVLDAGAVPGFVINPNGDHLAANAIGRALCGYQVELYIHAHLGFTDPRAHGFYRDLALIRRNMVALLRTALGHDPLVEELGGLVAELSAASAKLPGLWNSHDMLR